MAPSSFQMKPNIIYSGTFMLFDLRSEAFLQMKSWEVLRMAYHIAKMDNEIRSSQPSHKSGTLVR